jgi:Histidine kinase-like ATPase domain
MSVYRTHQITPTKMADGPWGEGASLLDPPGQASGTRGTRPPAPIAQAGQRQQSARCALRPEPCSAKAARDFTGAALREWGAADLLVDATVVISELVTNAVRYGSGASTANGGIELVLLRLGDHLVCVVTDPNPRPPVLVDADSVAETGRGLCVVEALTTRWGWTPLGRDRKAVWAALPVT